MIGKLCRAPSGGGSASGLVAYLIGYAVAEKGASKAEIRDALESVFVEAERRVDLGTMMWSPTVGAGTRPSSILVRNCASFSTASLEMDADALANPGVRNGAMHLVWSFQTGESGKLTDEQVHAYVGEVLQQLGLDQHRSVAVVHRDTIVYERDGDGNIVRDGDGKFVVKDGNVHVHVAVGSVNPETGFAYDRTQLYKRMAWAERKVELAHGLAHDRGLAVVRDAGTLEARVDWADKHELVAWRAQRQEERMLRLERRSWDGYRRRDRTFKRFADATVAPRLRAAIQTAMERGRVITWADLHTVAARYGTVLEMSENGRIMMRDVGIGEMRYQHGRDIIAMHRQFREKNVEPNEVERQIAERKAEHAQAEAAERVRKSHEGETVSLECVLPEAVTLSAYQTVAESERNIITCIEANPKMVLEDVTSQSSTFSREDVDLWLTSRLSDPEDIERLGDLVMREDSIRVLNLDTPQALMTTTEILAIEDRLAEDAQALACTDSGITREQIERAIATYEREQSETLGTSFKLNDEQRNALYVIARGSLVSIEGLPGVGKTTLMGVVRVLGQQIHREVVGLTLSQAAAERLESEAGFRAINTSRAALLEDKGEQIIPHRGLVVVDEAAMIDSRANCRILALAKERGCIVQEIYDTRQLQPIDFGASARIIRDAGKAAGTHAELRDIQRQRNDWHRQAVATLADAIVECDADKRLALVRTALKTLDCHGGITWVEDRDGALDKAVQTKRLRQAFGPGLDVRIIAADKDTVRHLAEEDRRRAGLDGRGLCFLTQAGAREISVGDSLVFLENSLGKRGLGVLNGDHGEVVRVSHDRIAVRLHERDTVVEFSPRSYKAWDHANATSVHKVQGANVDGCVCVLDRSASAELFFVAASRSKHSLDLIVAQSSFADLDELAEHVADRISLKTTTRNYEEILERTGGKETMRVLNIEAQREAPNAPLRRVWEAKCKEPTLQIRDERMRELRAIYQQRKHEIGDATLTLDERITAERAALSEFRSAAAAIYKETQPQRYADWLDERETAHARACSIRHERGRYRIIERDCDLRQEHDRCDNERNKEHEFVYGHELER